MSIHSTSDESTEEVMKFCRVPAGSTAKFSYTVNPLIAGFYSARPAKITYRAFPDAPEKTVRLWGKSFLNLKAEAASDSTAPCAADRLLCSLHHGMTHSQEAVHESSVQVATSSTPHFHILSTVQKYVQAGLTAVHFFASGGIPKQLYRNSPLSVAWQEMSNEICLFFWHEAPCFVFKTFSLHWLCKDRSKISTFFGKCC